MTIKQRQCLLFYLGYYVGEIDGLWGTLSSTATKAFQKDVGIKADGIVREDTEKALKNAVYNGIVKKDIWDTVKYFKRSEFKCRCGKYCNGFPVEPDEDLVELAERVRVYFGKPVNLSSGIRCEKHNKNVGGVVNSRHLRGKAMDFCVSGFTAEMVLPYVQSLNGVRYAYAIDRNYVHMDVD